MWSYWPQTNAPFASTSPVPELQTFTTMSQELVHRLLSPLRGVGGLFVCFLNFSFYIPRCPGVHSVGQAGLELLATVLV